MATTPSAIGRYQVVRRLGAGGMGSVFLARDPDLDRDVAIKLVKDDLTDDPELRERFSREARSAARLRHPNIVTVFDIGEYEGRPFIAMEYVPGESLSDAVKRKGPIPLGRLLKWMESLCSGLAHAHRAGIVHRDIKPANMMVDGEGVLKIVDFGIARLADSHMTREGVLVGTVNYMAPEQIVGATPDHRADIFAVGAVFYELLSFQKAFPGSIADGLFMRICHEPPPSLEVLCPGLDAGVVSVVTRALEKDANARYQDLAVMARDIAAVRMRLESAGQLEETVVTIAPGDLPAVSAATITPAGTPRPFPTGSATPQLTDPNLQRILGELEQARERTDRLRTALQNAREALGQGFFDAAIKAGEEALALDPTVGEARDIVQQAKSAVAERQRHAATEAARRVIEAARAALESGDETGARELLDAVKAPTEALEAAVAELREKIGDTERRRQRRAGIFIDAAELAIGQLDFARAASLLDDAARVDASLPAIATLRSQVDAALTAAREAETARTTAAAAMKEADAAFARGDFAAARAHATRALTADPQLWAASAMLSRVQQAERLAEQRARQQELALAEAARRRARLSAAIAIVVAIGVTVVAFLLTR